MRQLLIILLAALAFGCAKKNAKMPVSDDFESLTGKGLPAWGYVQTKEDHEHLQFFKRLYDLKKGLMTAANTEARIPQVAHFIWIGPKPFPRESVENVRTWMAKNPDWTFYFWTDRSRPLPCPGMQMRRIQDLTLQTLQACYEKADNYGEKSDLLRYEILYQEGGVYIDHDVKCFKPFASLNRAYDFYCGIDMPYTSSLPSCVFTTNNLIGSKPGHPILHQCIQKLAAKWDEIQSDYPGADRDAMLNRVLHRTFWLFGEAVRERANAEGTQDIVFPAYYFDAPKDELALYARHVYAGSWHETESAFEKMVRQRLMLLSKKSNKILLFFGVVGVLNLLGLIGLFFMLKRLLRKAH